MRRRSRKTRILGISIAVVLIAFLALGPLGVDLGELFGDEEIVEPAPKPTGLDHCREQSAAASTDCQMVVMFAAMGDFWAQRGVMDEKPEPTMEFLYQNTPALATACGEVQAGSGPLYCPQERVIYLDVPYLQTLGEQMRDDAAVGPSVFYQVYPLAYLWARHIQEATGEAERVRDTGESDAELQLELGAECLAGVWAAQMTDPSVEREGPLVEPFSDSDLQVYLQTATALTEPSPVGLGLSTDATIPERQEAFNHGMDAMADGQLEAGTEVQWCEIRP